MGKENQKYIFNIKELLSIENLNIPDYQRPYKWNQKNMLDLLQDIDTAIINSEKYNEFKYRIGTIIVHNNNTKIDIVDRSTKNNFSCINK